MNTSLNYASCSITGLWVWVFFKCPLLSAPYPHSSLSQQRYKSRYECNRSKFCHANRKGRGAATSGDAQTMPLGHRGSRLDAPVAASTENQICCCFLQIPPCSPGRGALAAPQPHDIPGAAPQPPRRPRPRNTGPDTHPQARDGGQQAGSTAAGNANRTALFYCFKGTFYGAAGWASPGSGKRQLQHL